MRIVIVVTVLVLCIAASTMAQVNGFEEEIGGIPVFHVWGTDYQMGHALGYLDGDRGKYVVEEGLVPGFGGLSGWEAARGLFNEYFQVPQRIRDIVAGMIAGIGDRPDSILYSTVLGRDMDTLDIYVGHSRIDLSVLAGIDLGLACTSVTAWDSATVSAPELLGAPAMVRNQDESFNPIALAVPAVNALSPFDGNQTVLFNWAMNIDGCSAMNEYGVCVTRNAGNYEIVTTYEPDFVSIGYTAVLGLMEDDFDGSGTNDLGDLVTALTYWNIAPSRIWHTAAPRNLAYQDEPAVVVEINNAAGFEPRYAYHDTVIGPDHMIATNHHRLLYPPTYCWRYALLSDSLQADPNMTLDRFWDFMGHCNQGNWTTLTVLLLPESREVGIAYADTIQESWAKDPFWMTWDDLFPPTGIPRPPENVGAEADGQGNVAITWSPVTEDVTGVPIAVNHYEVYRGATAYFSIVGLTPIGTPSLPTFTDQNAAGDPSVNHSYRVVAIPTVGTPSAPSDPVGEFDFMIATTVRR